MTDVPVPAREFAGSLGGRVVFWAQLIVLVVYLIGSYGILLSAVVHRHDPGALLHPGLGRLDDPKDSIPIAGPDSVWNPLVWLFGLSRVVAFFVYPLAILALVVGGIGLLDARRRDPVVFRRLLVTTGAWLLVGVVAVTPYGGHLLTWLLD